MKKNILFLVAIMIYLSAYEQNMDVLQVDKLKQELASAKEDSSQALIMTQLAEAYRDRITDTSFYYAQKALEISRRIDYPKGEAKALIALSYFFFNRGNLAKALEFGLKGLDIAKTHDLKYDQPFAMIRLGNVYMGMRDYREALRYFHQTRLMTKNSEFTFFYAVTFWRAADAYNGLNLVDSALFFAKIAEDTAIKMGNRFILSGIAPTLGNLYAKKGNDQLALKYYYMNRSAYGATSLASFYKSRGVYDSALYYAHKAYEFAITNKVKNSELAAATLLSSLYESSDPRAALQYQKIAMAAKDSLFGAENVLAVKTLAFEEKERQNEILMTKMSYRNKIKIYVSLAGLVLVLFVALLLYRNNRNERKANALLQQQKNEIAKALSDLKITQSQLVQSEKMASLGELTAGIAHEIQNPLNFVNNFSEVNKELIEELKSEKSKVKSERDEKLEDELINNIAENEKKIIHHGKRADAIVKNMLQHSRTSSGQKEPTDINALADEYLRLAYHGLRAKDKSFNATTKTDFGENIGTVNIIPQDIGRVILNLINNAFYAVDEKKKLNQQGYEPTVSVSTRRNNGKVEINVKDNGNGIPQKVLDKIFQPFFTTKPTGQGTGLGLSLSYDIVKAHGGELKVETKEGEGSNFIIHLPVV
jgi:two-component system NtrC family sensor kinase